jgi:hypothetical protein
VNNINIQSSSCVSSATPLLVQCLSDLELFILIIITKLVEWPVVLKVPRLLDVL